MINQSASYPPPPDVVTSAEVAAVSLDNLAGCGTNVKTALAIAIGSAGAPVVMGGALGTPSGGTLTNCSGLPIAGIASLGTGVGTALAVELGQSGALARLSDLPTALAIGSITGLGTGVGTALAAAPNATGGVVLFKEDASPTLALLGSLY
jgi:hypothetical protein